jgi:ABC-type amino acid transport substrate-binding protein
MSSHVSGLRFTPISPRRRYALRSFKYLLLIGLVFSMIGCGKGKKEIPSAEETMIKKKEVTIVTYAVNAPFEFGEGTGVQGYDAEIATEIAKELGYPLNWAKTELRKGYSHTFDVVKEGGGEILISSAAIDPLKEKVFDFSKPYYETGDVIAHQRSEFGIKDLASLTGKKVGVAEGRPGDTFMTSQKTAANVTIKKYPTMDDALGALNRTEVDAVVGDEMLINYSSVKSYPNTNVRPTLINKYSYAVAVRKGETELLKKINTVIDRMKSSGDLAKLEATLKFAEIKEEAQNRAKGDENKDTLTKAPKIISVTINKVNASWAMDSLDGFVFVLEGASGRYQSTPILTEGNRGNCKFTTPVPPGDYRLNISILRLVAAVHVPAEAKSSLAMELNISKDATIRFK